MENLAIFQFVETEAATNLRGNLTDFAQGSRNLIPRGSSQFKPFENLKPLDPLTGSRQMFLLRDGFGGLNDYTIYEEIGDDAILAILKEGQGSVFSYIADSIWYCGQGKVSINGVETTNEASNLLHVLLKWNNSYTDPKSGPYLVGIAEPSTPLIALSDSYAGDVPQMNGNFILQYSRLSQLGGRSRASAPTSIFNIPTGKALAVTVPLPTTNTEGHVFFITQRQSAGNGKTLRLSRANYWTQAEFTENDIQRTVSVGVTSGSDSITGTGFTQADVGKRFNPLTVGYSVPDGTTIQTYVSPSNVILSNNVPGTTGTISAEFIAYANDIDRTIVLNWKETEITSEEAWIYDFPPPPCSHAFSLGSRTGVVANADSTAETSISNQGSAIIPSLRNQPESFDMRYPIYLEEKIIDVLSRPQSDFVFFGAENGIYAVQEIASDLTPFVVRNLLRGEGIKNHKNWAWSKNALYMATAKGKICRLVGDGNIDTSFADKISYLLKGLDHDKFIISYDPKNDGVCVHHPDIPSLFFDEQTGRWSTELYLNDTYDGEIVSAIGATSKMLVTLKNEEDFNLYEWDEGVATDTLSMSPYVSPGGNYQKIIQRIAAQYVTDKTNKTLWLGVHANNLKTHCRKVIVEGSTVVSPDEDFSPEMRGFYVLIQSAGLDNNWHLAKIAQIVDVNTLELTHDVPVDVANVYCLVARNIYPIKVNRKGTQQLESPELFINQLQDFAISMLIETDGLEAQALNIFVDGNISGEQWNLPSNVWGLTAEGESTLLTELLEYGELDLIPPSPPEGFELTGGEGGFSASWEESEGEISTYHLVLELGE